MRPHIIRTWRVYGITNLVVIYGQIYRCLISIHIQTSDQTTLTYIYIYTYLHSVSLYTGPHIEIHRYLSSCVLVSPRLCCPLFGKGLCSSGKIWRVCMRQMLWNAPWKRFEITRIKGKLTEISQPLNCTGSCFSPISSQLLHLRWHRWMLSSNVSNLFNRYPLSIKHPF